MNSSYIAASVHERGKLPYSYYLFGLEFWKSALTLKKISIRIEILGFSFFHLLMSSNSNSKGKDAEGISGVKKLDENENYEQEMNFLQTEQLQNGLNNGILDPMAQIPPYGSRAYRPPSQMVTPQVR